MVIVNSVFNWLLALPEFYRQVIFLSALLVPALIGMILLTKDSK